ncbi:MAG: HDOD domain-containing protein [Desulfobacterales bacterium]|nr:HDOD domain-containing protein [Desulfobacterales bacterium]
MKLVLIASTDSKEAEKISNTLPQDQKAAIIQSSDQLVSLSNGSAIVIVDHNFYEQYGLDFFKDILKNPHPPFLMLAPPDDIQTMVEIMEIGMHHIPKIPDYQKLLGLAVNNALAQINEQEQLKQTIVTLQKSVKELESAEREEKAPVEGQSSFETKPHEVKTNILDEIVFVFKRGEIELPTLPQMSIRFQEMVNKGINLQDIGELLKQDTAISSKLISVSNSVYYRGITESKNLGQAISRLGLKNAKRYVDAICNRSLYATKNKRFVKLLERLWEHSLACAYASQILDESLALNLQDDAFTMGLLHDIGRLLLFQIIGDLQLKKKLGDEIENEELLNTIDGHHGKFGAALLKKWKFSEGFVKIAAYHDNSTMADSITKDMAVVHFANLMVKSLGYTTNGSEGDPMQEINLEDTESARFLGLDVSMIDEYKDQVSTFMQDLKGLFA